MRIEAGDAERASARSVLSPSCVVEESGLAPAPGKPPGVASTSARPLGTLTGGAPHWPAPAHEPLLSPEMKADKNWERFEHEVGMLVQAFGYEAETTQPSHDYGVDVLARNDRRRVVIQCKLYGKGRIGGDRISQLAGTRQLFEASDAICITTSRFTRQAREIAERLGIHLIDGTMLEALCCERKIVIPSLTVLRAEGKAFSLSDHALVSIGRTPDNTIYIAHSAVSRRHAIVQRVGLALTLVDQGSTNGTLISGIPIRAPHQLSYGSSFQVGPAVFGVEMLTPAEATQVTLLGSPSG